MFVIELRSVTNYVNNMVLLQVGIERKTHDMDSVYTTYYLDCVKLSETFTSTAVVGNSLRYFALYEKNSAMGSNKNKLYRVVKTEEQKKAEKKDKFAGAFVMNPAHCSPTGFKLLGQLNKYIHDNAIDFDITSELNTVTRSSDKIALILEILYSQTLDL